MTYLKQKQSGRALWEKGGGMALGKDGEGNYKHKLEEEFIKKDFQKGAVKKPRSILKVFR